MIAASAAEGCLFESDIGNSYKSFIIEAHVVSTRHLEVQIDKLTVLAPTSTVLSSPVVPREYRAAQIGSLAQFR